LVKPLRHANIGPANRFMPTPGRMACRTVERKVC